MHINTVISAVLAGQLASAGVLPYKRALVTSFVTTITTTVPPSTSSTGVGFIGAPGAKNGSASQTSAFSLATASGAVSIGISLQNAASLGPDVSSILSKIESAESKGYTLGGVEVTFVPETSHTTVAPASSPQAKTTTLILTAPSASASSSPASSSPKKAGTSTKSPSSSAPSHSTTSIPKSALPTPPVASGPDATSGGGIQIVPLSPSVYTTSKVGPQTFTMTGGSVVVTLSSSQEQKTTYVTYASKMSSAVSAKSSDTSSVAHSESTSKPASAPSSSAVSKSSSVPPVSANPSSSETKSSQGPASAPLATHSASPSALPSPSSSHSLSSPPAPRSSSASAPPPAPPKSSSVSPPPPKQATTAPPSPPKSPSPATPAPTPTSSNDCPYPGLRC
ncbi:MAG: hypothetical protein M1822_003136 [Bathelium mastoideum]|nr:MAG: hypothetical protein M1822_003136 [Bathelium mastoideum]